MTNLGNFFKASSNSPSAEDEPWPLAPRNATYDINDDYETQQNVYIYITVERFASLAILNV